MFFILCANSSDMKKMLSSCTLLLCTLLLCRQVAVAQYCTPSYMPLYGCSFGDQINTFNLTGSASTSIADAASGCASGSYQDNHSTMSVTLNPGGSYTAYANSSLLTINTDYIQIWIDFNNNNTFEASESIGGGGPVTSTLTALPITIPSGAATGSYRMRVVLSGEEVYPSVSACPSYSLFSGGNVFGEVHDYTVVISGSAVTCSAVTGLAASSITSSSALISWTAVSGSIGYEYVIDNVSTVPTGSGTATTSTTYSASGLTASTTYYAHVRNNCGSGNYSAWVTIPFTTLGTVTCASVTGLTASAITSSSATVTWTAVSGSTGYEYVTNTTAADPTGSGTATTATTYNATGLTASTTYYAHVRNNCGSGNFSAWVTIPFTTLGSSSTCPAITGLTASSVTASSATVSWSAATGSLGYQYVINTTVTAPTGSGTNTTATSTSPTGLTAGTTYYAHVRDSCSTTSFSAWSTIPFTTLSASCNAVTALTASAVTSTSATISWTPASGAVGAQYVINTNTADPTTSGTPTTSSSANAVGLIPATLYYAHVRDSCGATALSAWVTIPFTTAGSVGVANINNTAIANLKVYPNPVTDVMTVELDGMNGAPTGDLQIFDVTGKQVWSVAVNNSVMHIDTHNLPAGTYVVRFANDAGRVMTKIYKQ